MQAFVGKPDEGIDDPFGGSLPVYQSCFDNEIRPAIDALLAQTPDQ